MTKLKRVYLNFLSLITAGPLVICLFGSFLATWIIGQTNLCIAQDKRFLFGVALHGYPITAEKIRETTTLLTVPPNIVQFYLQWPERPSKGIFPMESLKTIWKEGAVPCITWEPMFVRGNQEVAIESGAILSGKYDAYIDTFSKGAAAFGRPILIRFGHEMNLSRYHWGTTKDNYGAESPAEYRKMFRYVVDRFNRTSGSSVAWVFSPNAESVPQSDWNSIAAYYPGDTYVDVLGVDGYEWHVSEEANQNLTPLSPFRKVFYEAVRELQRISQRKPILVFETATSGSTSYKKAWIENAVLTAKTWGLSGIVWFHALKERDWRLPPFSTPPNLFVKDPSREKGQREVVKSLFR